MMEELIGAFQIAIGAAILPQNLLLIFIGTMFGLIVGTIPGIGGVVALALLIPITYGMDPLSAFMLLTSTLGGVTFGGSITAILLNIPGSAPNAATILDGYPMARNGEGGRAIGASAVASASGAIFGAFVLLLSIPVITEVILLFQTPEIFWLGVLGITIIAVVVKGAVITGLISALIGVIITFPGVNIMTGNERWTFDIVTLYDGFPLVPLILGLFAIAEVALLLEEKGQIAKTDGAGSKVTGRIQGMKDAVKHPFVVLRGSIIGSVIGMIPGVGAVVATFLSYSTTVQLSKDNSRFGKGDVRGVLASESTNDAKDGGSLIPTLGFGIPGGAGSAILLGAFQIHGMSPGPSILTDHLDIVAVIIISLIASNILTSAVGLASTNYLIKITQIDIHIFGPAIVLISFISTYAINSNPLDMGFTLVAGVIGYVLVKVDISRIPLLIAFILAPIIEQTFFRTLQLSGGGYGIFIENTVSKILVLIIVLSFVLPRLDLSGVAERLVGRL